MKTTSNKRLVGVDIAGVAAVAAVLSFMQAPAPAQTPAATKASAPAVHKLADGKPDFNGIWEALNTASWDIQDHTGQLGIPPGMGVVEGNEIPYLPAALAKKKENFANRKTADLTEANCFLPGVPRITYMPYPFQITQSAKAIAFSYEFDHALRVIHMEGQHPDPNSFLDTWLGDSRGHWEGDTLVVDSRNFNDQTWFDKAGNFHSEALHVVERYSLADADHINYEVTIDDPKVFTKAWKMSMPLYRRMEKNAKLLEYECVFYLQEERYKNAPFTKK
ncbi:MAG: hypothetical protein ABSG41_13825 [Bryobacteraceae bacterium]|jgi:hypothetical protein